MSHEVISAFIDNEPFDAAELGRVLAEPGGRELLLDLLALRSLVDTDSTAKSSAPATMAPPVERRRWVALGFAAATFVFAVGGGLIFNATRNASTAATPSTSGADVPPTPDRVVTFEPGLEWHEANR